MSINPELLASSDYYVEALARKTGIVYPNKPTWNAGDAAYPDAPFDLTFSGGGGAYYYQSSERLLSPATADVPVLAYDSEGNVLGLWGGVANTNLFEKSNNFSNAYWTKDSVGTGVDPVITPAFALSPKGDMTAQRLQLNSGAGGTNSDLSFVFTRVDVSAIPHGLEIFAKSNTGTNQVLALLANTTSFQEIIITPNWQKFTFFNTPAASLREYGFLLRGGNSLGATTSDILVWNAKLCPSPISLPMVETDTTPVTAPANIITGALPAAITGASAISGACVVNVPANASGVEQTLFEMHDTTANNSIKIYINTGNKYALRIVDGGGTPVEIETATLPVAQTVKLAWEVGASIMRLSMNGATEASATTGVTLPTVTNIHLMSNRLGALQLNGYCNVEALKGALVGETILNEWSDNA